MAEMSSTDNLVPMFRELLELMKTQNGLIKGQAATLQVHTGMLGTLQTDVTKRMYKLVDWFIWSLMDTCIDEKAYQTKGLEDEQAWGPLEKEAIAKIKAIVEGWKDLMNISLIFVCAILSCRRRGRTQID